MKKITTIVLGAITASILTGCASSGSQIPVYKPSNTVETVKAVDKTPYKKMDGLMYKDELIVDKNGKILSYAIDKGNLFYIVKDVENKKFLLKNANKRIVKSFDDIGSRLHRYYVHFSQTENGSIYLYEEYGDIYKSISKFENGLITNLFKNKELQPFYNRGHVTYAEIQRGNIIVNEEYNSIGTLSLTYKNINKSFTEKDVSLEPGDYPVIVAKDNIVYTVDDDYLVVLDTLTDNRKVIATNDVRFQFLLNGQDRYLRIITDDIGSTSTEKHLDKKGYIIDLSTLKEVKFDNLEDLTVVPIWYTYNKAPSKQIYVYDVEHLEEYLRYIRGSGFLGSII